jgi:hypothetical protein
MQIKDRLMGNNQSRFNAPKTKHQLNVRTEAELIAECDIDTLILSLSRFMSLLGTISI